MSGDRRQPFQPFDENDGHSRVIRHRTSSTVNTTNNHSTNSTTATAPSGFPRKRKAQQAPPTAQEWANKDNECDFLTNPDKLLLDAKTPRISNCNHHGHRNSGVMQQQMSMDPSYDMVVKRPSKKSRKKSKQVKAEEEKTLLRRRRDRWKMGLSLPSINEEEESLREDGTDGDTESSSSSSSSAASSLTTEGDQSTCATVRTDTSPEAAELNSRHTTDTTEGVQDVSSGDNAMVGRQGREQDEILREVPRVDNFSAPTSSPSKQRDAWMVQRSTNSALPKSSPERTQRSKLEHRTPQLGSPGVSGNVRQAPASSSPIAGRFVATPILRRQYVRRSLGSNVPSPLVMPTLRRSHSETDANPTQAKNRDSSHSQDGIPTPTRGILRAQDQERQVPLPCVSTPVISRTSQTKTCPSNRHKHPPESSTSDENSELLDDPIPSTNANKKRLSETAANSARSPDHTLLDKRLEQHFRDESPPTVTQRRHSVTRIHLSDGHRPSSPDRSTTSVNVPREVISHHEGPDQCSTTKAKSQPSTTLDRPLPSNASRHPGRSSYPTPLHQGPTVTSVANESASRLSLLKSSERGMSEANRLNSNYHPTQHRAPSPHDEDSYRATVSSPVERSQQASRPQPQLLLWSPQRSSMIKASSKIDTLDLTATRKRDGRSVATDDLGGMTIALQDHSHSFGKFATSRNRNEEATVKQLQSVLKSSSAHKTMRFNSPSRLSPPEAALQSPKLVRFKTPISSTVLLHLDEDESNSDAGGESLSDSECDLEEHSSSTDGDSSCGSDGGSSHSGQISEGSNGVAHAPMEPMQGLHRARMESSRPPSHRLGTFHGFNFQQEFSFDLARSANSALAPGWTQGICQTTYYHHPIFGTTMFPPLYLPPPAAVYSNEDPGAAQVLQHQGGSTGVSLTRDQVRSHASVSLTGELSNQSNIQFSPFQRSLLADGGTRTPSQPSASSHDVRSDKRLARHPSDDASRTPSQPSASSSKGLSSDRPTPEAVLSEKLGGTNEGYRLLVNFSPEETTTATALLGLQTPLMPSSIQQEKSESAQSSDATQSEDRPTSETVLSEKLSCTNEVDQPLVYSSPEEAMTATQLLGLKTPGMPSSSQQEISQSEQVAEPRTTSFEALARGMQVERLYSKSDEYLQPEEKSQDTLGCGKVKRDRNEDSFMVSENLGTPVTIQTAKYADNRGGHQVDTKSDPVAIDSRKMQPPCTSVNHDMANSTERPEQGVTGNECASDGRAAPAQARFPEPEDRSSATDDHYDDEGPYMTPRYASTAGVDPNAKSTTRRSVPASNAPPSTQSEALPQYDDDFPIPDGDDDLLESHNSNLAESPINRTPPYANRSCERSGRRLDSTRSSGVSSLTSDRHQNVFRQNDFMATPVTINEGRLHKKISTRMSPLILPQTETWKDNISVMSHDEASHPDDIRMHEGHSFGSRSGSSHRYDTRMSESHSYGSHSGGSHSTMSHRVLYPPHKLCSLQNLESLSISSPKVAKCVGRVVSDAKSQKSSKQTKYKRPGTASKVKQKAEMRITRKTPQCGRRKKRSLVIPLTLRRKNRATLDAANRESDQSAACSSSASGARPQSGSDRR